MKIKSLNANKHNLSLMLFLLCLCWWVSLTIYGAFSDPNVTIQEGSNILDEVLSINNNIAQFIFAGNSYGHQHLYHLLVYFVGKSLGCINDITYFYIGRVLSIFFGFLSIITALKLVKKFVTNTNPYFLTSLIMFHPLFFFYCLQAEPYSMLFFISTLQLLIYHELGTNKASSWFFLTISICGYFTHYCFLFLLFAECINELFCYIKNKNIKLLPFSTLLLIFVIVYFQPPYVLKTDLMSYVDGYFIPSWSIYLKMLGTFFGITPVTFFDPMVYFLSIASLIIFFYFVLKNRNFIPGIISIYFVSLLMIFVLFNIFAFLNGWAMPTIRHYFHIILPCIIIICISISKFKRNSYFMLALIILCVFVVTDWKIVYTKYKYDGLSVIRYLNEKAELTDRNNHLILINPAWSSYGILTYNKTSPINIYFYERKRIRLINNMLLPPLFYDEYSPTAIAFKNRIYLDSGFKIDQLNKFMYQKRSTQLLSNILKNSPYKLNYYEMLFLKNKKVKRSYKNRLLLEMLYPQICPHTILKNELHIEDVIDYVINTDKASFFHLLYVNEYILGIDYIDTKIQETAINRMLHDRRIKLQEIKQFANVKIYTFIRK